MNTLILCVIVYAGFIAAFLSVWSQIRFKTPKVKK